MNEDNSEYGTVNSQDTQAEETPDISIVIVCWNNKSYLEPCLNSIYEAQNQVHFEILAVDNGSTDGSQAMLKEKYPQIRLIQNDHNVGLSRATNQGVKAAQGRYILLYNNDTLMEKSTLDIMVHFMDDYPEAGAAGGRLINPDGTFQLSHVKFPSIWSTFLDAAHIGSLVNPFHPSQPDLHQIREVNWISSACLVVRREALDQVGGLDETFFLYGDETDLQYRLWKAGWKVYFIPDITTVHYGSVSLNRFRKRAFFYRGILLYYYKNSGVFQAWLARIIIFTFSLLKILFWSLAYLFWRDKQRSKLELLSNISVLRLCLKSKRAILMNIPT